MTKLDLSKITKSKYLVPLLLAALGLMLILPRSSDSDASSESQTAPVFDIEAEQQRLEQTLSLINGAGKVHVLLSVSASGEHVFAENGDELAVISSGSGTEQAVELYSRSAEYLGAVIVCEGAENAEVRLALTKAAASFTGLGSNKITILDMK